MVWRETRSENLGLKTGFLGEDIACRYLVERRYRILGRNIRKKWGELDILAQSSNKTLVFIEVKTLRIEAGSPRILPEDNLTSKKLVKLRRACQAFANRNPELVDEAIGWRIDLVAIELSAEGSLKSIRHYENIT